MALNYNEKAVYDWIKLILPNMTVVRSDQRSVKTPKPFISFKILSDVPLGRSTQKTSNTQAPSGDYEATLSTQYRSTVSIQGFGRGIDEDLKLLQSSVASSKVKNLGQEKRVHFSNSTPVTDSNITIDDSWETRYIFEITIRYAISFAIEAPVIKTVEIDADIEGVSFEETITF